MPSKKATSRRRANGQGSIWWSEERQRYVGQITVYDAAGKAKRRTVMAKTQAELTDRLARLRSTVEATIDDPTNVTVARFLTYWLDDVLPLEQRAPATLRSYRDVCRLYIDPHIGRVAVADLTPRHVQRMMAALTAKGYGGSTVSKARKTLARALKVAVRDGLVVRNVAALVDGVAQPQTDRDSLTTEQAVRLLTVADDEGYGALVAVMLGLGLRRQEAIGLRWRDIDLDNLNPTLTVNGAIADGHDGRPVWSATKTKTSRRRLHLPSTLTASLHRHRVAQARDQLACIGVWGRDWPHDDFVFTTPVGTPLDLDRVTKLIIALADLAGIGHWTPHGLRHSAASILLAQGVSLKEISETLGHSSIRVTADIYAHLQEPARRSVADAMQAAIFD
jgi:integrase